MGHALAQPIEFSSHRKNLFQGIALGLQRDRMPYAKFIPEAWPIIAPAKPLISNWHIDCIAEHLQALTDNDIGDLIINMPPREGKSIFVSTLWPAWLWTVTPWLNFIFVSYSARLAALHSINRRRVIESQWYADRWGSIVSLRPDQNSKVIYENTARGVMMATSSTGSATGFGGDILLFDDFLNPKMAESKIEREKYLEQFDLTFSTRLNDKKTGHRVIVEHRLHHDDLTAHVLKQSGWTHLKLPAVAEEKTRIVFPVTRRVVVRERGDILHEQRTGKVELARQRVTLGGRGFAAQLQQSPEVRDAIYFSRDKWKFYSLPPEEMAKDMDELIQSWDFTFKDLQTSDFVAGGVVGQKGANFYVFDLVHDQLAFTASKAAMTTMTAKWPEAHAKLVEDKANGSAIIDELHEKIGGILPVNPEGSKEARAASISPYQEAGNIFLPEGAAWVEDFIREHSEFPNGQNDDRVDMLSQAIRYFLDKFRRQPRITVL